MTALAHFRGFPPAGASFFANLAANNNAEWFRAQKAIYERDLKTPMAWLVADLSVAFAERDVPLSGDPKRAIFRVSRDVRFSKDKSPYKTNISAMLSKDGDKRSQGVFYLQIGLEGAFAAMGFYALDPGPLTTFRRAIVARRAAWLGVVKGLAANGLTLGRDDALARLPRGFEASEVGDLAEAVKLKSFIVSMALDEASIRQAALVDRLADFAARGLPLLAFGWRALA